MGMMVSNVVFYVLQANSNYCTTKTYTHGKSHLFLSLPAVFV